MNYKTQFVPVDGNDQIKTVVSSDGVSHSAVTGGVVTEAQARSFAASLSNNSLVAQKAIANTVQPSTAQQAALLLYLAAIQAGTDTGAVETAIAGL